MSKKSVIRFTATWCAPCRALKPVMENLQKEDTSNISWETIDIDVLPETALAYEIRSVPTVVFVKDGEILSKLVGIYPRTEYVKALEELENA